MTGKRILFVMGAALWMALGVGFANAEDLTDTQRDGLAEIIEEYKEAVAQADYEAVVGYIPLMLRQFNAYQAGLSTEELRGKLVEAMRSMETLFTLESYAIDADEIEFLAAEDGTPYALLPTETVMALPNGKKFKTTSNTLAMLELGHWKLVRISNANQIEGLSMAFPAFADIDVPRGKTELVE